MKNINHFINSVAEMMEAQRIAKSPPRKTTRINCEKKEQIVRKMLNEHYEERLNQTEIPTRQSPACGKQVNTNA